MEEFKNNLRVQGLEFYVRGKNTLGVRNHQDVMKNGNPRVYRLKTLGLSGVFQEKLKQWERELEKELQKEAPELEW